LNSARAEELQAMESSSLLAPGRGLTRPAAVPKVGAGGTALLAAVVALALIHAPGAKAQREPTTQTSIGIFYLPGAPQTADLWQDGDPGERLKLQGRVLDRHGRPVSGALVELWHADSSGSVDESRYRSAQRTREDGGFGIKTAMPGHIEMARYNAVFAPRHIHIAVSHPDHPRLISLIFFQGDERLDGTPYPELAVPLEKVRTQDGEVFVAGVEVILGAAPPPAGYWEDTD
jgi:protocatechuate 3,4-dioxygenase beta subunit